LDEIGDRQEVDTMKAVVGFFDFGEARTAQDALLVGGFRPEDVKVLTTISDVPEYLEGEPEKMTSWGWLIGTALGALVGAAIGWLVMSRYSMQFIVLTVLLSAAIGGAIGGYLLALYFVRADVEPDMEIRASLSEGKALLVAMANGAGVRRAIRIMNRNNSRHTLTYPVPAEEAETA
jgi:hypothetical protein